MISSTTTPIPLFFHANEIFFFFIQVKVTKAMCGMYGHGHAMHGGQDPKVLLDYYRSYYWTASKILEKFEVKIVVFL